MKRNVGMQTPAAPEVQVRNVVWSSESFCLLSEQPNHQNTRIRWSLLLSHSCRVHFRSSWCIQGATGVKTFLFFSASLTATTGGVVVSGTFGRSGHCTGLALLEFGLKINGEQWIQVCRKPTVPEAIFLCHTVFLQLWSTLLEFSFRRWQFSEKSVSLHRTAPGHTASRSTMSEMQSFRQYGTR